MICRSAAVCRALLALAGVVPGLTAVAAAQTTASVEAGITRVRYAGDPALSLFAISPFVQFEQPDGWLAAMATLSRFDGGGWGLQTTLTGSRYLPATFGLRPEISASAEASRGQDASLVGEAGGRVRLHLLGPTSGVWGGAGVAWADGLLGTHAVRGMDLGGWVRHGMLTVVASVEPEWIGDSIRAVDTEALARVVRGPLEVAAFGGVRQQRHPASASERWGGITGAWWFGSHVAATLGIGSYPSDLAREFAAGRYATLAIRLATRRPDPPERVDQPAYRLLPPLARPVVAEFGTEPVDAERRRIVVRAPGADGVDIMGDFTDWQAIPLSRDTAGRWVAEVPLSPGVHRLNVRVAGGEWGVPPGIPVVRDDFNGVVGLLTVQ